MKAEELFDIAWQATQIGADILASSHPITVRKKGDRDLVTDVDLRIQRDVTSYLTRAAPHIAVLGEESSEQPDVAAAEYLWVPDPIDGTSNFVHGLPLCTVSLPLLHHAHPVIAITRAPMLDRTYHAVAGRAPSATVSRSWPAQPPTLPTPWCLLVTTPSALAPRTCGVRTFFTGIKGSSDDTRFENLQRLPILKPCVMFSSGMSSVCHFFAENLNLVSSLPESTSSRTASMRRVVSADTKHLAQASADLVPLRQLAGRSGAASA